MIVDLVAETNVQQWTGCRGHAPCSVMSGSADLELSASRQACGWSSIPFSGQAVAQPPRPPDSLAQSQDVGVRLRPSSCIIEHPFVSAYQCVSSISLSSINSTTHPLSSSQFIFYSICVCPTAKPVASKHSSRLYSVLYTSLPASCEASLDSLCHCWRLARQSSWTPFTMKLLL